jgi:hypothetical protein
LVKARLKGAIMRPEYLNQFLSGATMMGWFVSGLFFFRFWKKSRDRLFLMFAIAFFVLGINRVGLTFSDEEFRPFLYGIRLVAFVIILVAIIDKNRSKVTR